MGECSVEITKIVFDTSHPELTEVYVCCRGEGDLPAFGVVGWHHKTFPGSKSCKDILITDVKHYLDWPQAAPKI